MEVISLDQLVFIVAGLNFHNFDRNENLGNCGILEAASSSLLGSVALTRIGAFEIGALRSAASTSGTFQLNATDEIKL